MADTIGDVFARNFRSGKAIGEDFSTMRYARGEEKIRQKYNELAKSEGKNLEDYRGQIQTELDDLYTKTGARKRRVTGADGAALPDASIAGMDKRAIGDASVRAGTQARGGDLAGSRRTLSDANFATGNYDAGVQNAQAGDIIGASTAAIGKGPGGQYDAAGAAGAMSGIQARYGNMEGAIGAGQKAEGFRFEAAAGLAGKLAMMLDNPAQFGDQITGVWEGVKQYLPEVGNIDIRVAGGKPVIYTNGKATGSIDTPEEVEQVKSMLASITRDPKSVLPAWTQQRITEAQHQRDRNEKMADDTNESVRKVIADFKSTGGDAAATAAQNLVQAQQRAALQGWKFAPAREDGAIPATIGNRAFLILPAQAAGADGTPGYQSRVIDAITGQNVDPKEIGQQGAALVDYSLKLGELMSQRASALSREDLRFKIDLLNQVGRPGASGGSAPRSGRNNNPGNIEDGPFARSQPGYKGSDGRFAVFDSAENGSAAQTALLRSYGERGFNTVSKIVSRWSPEGDPGNAPGSTRNYAAYVARKLGVQPDQQLNLSDPNVTAALQQAMAEFEGGNTSATPAQVASSPVQLPSAPAARTAAQAPNAAAQPSLLQVRDQMLAAQDELQRWNEELRQFASQNATGAIGMDPSGRSSMRNPQLYERIVAERDKAKQKFEALLSMTRQGTQAMNQQTQSRGIDTQFAQIQQRVAGGGAAGQTAATNPNGNSTLDSIVRQSLR